MLQKPGLSSTEGNGTKGAGGQCQASWCSVGASSCCTSWHLNSSVSILSSLRPYSNDVPKLHTKKTAGIWEILSHGKK